MLPPEYGEDVAQTRSRTVPLVPLLDLFATLPADKSIEVPLIDQLQVPDSSMSAARAAGMPNPMNNPMAAAKTPNRRMTLFLISDCMTWGS
jgi:hypothetical protein